MPVLRKICLTVTVPRWLVGELPLFFAVAYPINEIRVKANRAAIEHYLYQGSALALTGGLYQAVLQAGVGKNPCFYGVMAFAGNKYFQDAFVGGFGLFYLARITVQEGGQW